MSSKLLVRNTKFSLFDGHKTSPCAGVPDISVWRHRRGFGLWIRVALKIFGGKWKLCIIDAINKGIVRPVEIHKAIPGSSLRGVEMQLAELLFFGVVDKCSGDVYPKKSEYELTVLGKSLLPILTQIDKWGMVHSEFIKERQQELKEIW